MSKRPVDKSKKSNIKCEYCGHWTGWEQDKCLLSGETKLYYHRCKKFIWRDDLKYKEDA